MTTRAPDAATGTQRPRFASPAWAAWARVRVAGARCGVVLAWAWVLPTAPLVGARAAPLSPHCAACGGAFAIRHAASGSLSLRKRGRLRHETVRLRSRLRVPV